MAVRIISVNKGSIAYNLSLERGDVILRINGQDVEDILDLRFLTAEEKLILEVKREEGRIFTFEIEKDWNVPLGVEVEPIKPRGCKCRCIFCFMDQMPKGLRKSLYLKDDDYRLSFLFGNYITLTNLTQRDWDRIRKLKLSPLYISVHATIPHVRVQMMRHPAAANIMSDLRRLASMGIQFHTQIVLCPGINDGWVLEKTLDDLATLFPYARSVAVVPVGLTRYRKGLYPLKGVDGEKARQVLDFILKKGEVYLKELGTRFVFPADEFFLKAGWPLPSSDFYEDFCQIEDGVGMVTHFVECMRKRKLNKKLRDFCFVTGCAFYPFLRRVLNESGCEDCEVVAIENRFFGEEVNVAGLLVAEDIIKLLNTSSRFVVLPRAMFNDDGLTIDDYSVDALEHRLRRRVFVAPSEPEEFADFLDSL